MSTRSTPQQSARLERVIGVVLRGGVLVSSVCLTAGLLLSLAGSNVVRFVPPLIVGKAEIDEAIEILDHVLGEAR